MRALALFSGGLDSMIAMKLMAVQGIDVTAININIGFGGTKDVSALFRSRAEAVGADFEVIDVREEYLKEVLFTPKYGYGKRFNPCVDCHAFMMKSAKALLGKFGASFIITGEVLGQRPMSQNSKALKNVLELSNDEDNIILRPMSAKLLPPTKPEIEGWVDREKLLDIEGRDRKRQLSLAAEFGFEEFASPGGGCLLTDIYFTAKLRDFVAYQPLKVEDIAFLKVGRHFRLQGGSKLILGRNEAENNILEGLKNDAFVDIFLGDLPAPYGKISKNASAEDKLFAAKTALFYTKIERDKQHKVQIAGEVVETCSFDDGAVLKPYAVGV